MTPEFLWPRHMGQRYGHPSFGVPIGAGEPQARAQKPGRAMLVQLVRSVAFASEVRESCGTASPTTDASVGGSSVSGSS